MASGTTKSTQTQIVVETVQRSGISYDSGEYAYIRFGTDNSTIVKDGYTAIGIGGWQLTGTNATLARVGAVYMPSSTEARIQITNTSSITATYTVKLDVIYQKN